MKENRLYRIVNGRVIGGVAGGLAEYFGIDPTIIRILFILLTFMGGGGILLYLILWIVVPERYVPPMPYTKTFTAPESSTSGVGDTYEGFGTPVSPETHEPVNGGKKVEGSLIAGLVMILIGGFFLFERFIPSIHFSDFWPILLIAIGVLVIYKGFPASNKKEDESYTSFSKKENEPAASSTNKEDEPTGSFTKKDDEPVNPSTDNDQDNLTTNDLNN